MNKLCVTTTHPTSLSLARTRICQMLAIHSIRSAARRLDLRSQPLRLPQCAGCIICCPRDTCRPNISRRASVRWSLDCCVEAHAPTTYRLTDEAGTRGLPPKILWQHPDHETLFSRHSETTLDVTRRTTALFQLAPKVSKTISWNADGCETVTFPETGHCTPMP